MALLAAKCGFTVVVIASGALGGTRLHHGSYAVRALHASSRLHGEFFKGKKSGIDADLFTDSLPPRWWSPASPENPPSD